jgi:hypothetical protein
MGLLFFAYLAASYAVFCGIMSRFFISQPANSFSAYPFYIFIYYYTTLTFYIKREQLFSVGLFPLG